VYRFAPSASRHVATKRADDVDARIIARERARNARSQTDSKNHCEMGISSMSEYSCTTQMSALDSVCNGAAEPSRDIASACFRCQNFFVRNVVERANSERVGHSHRSEKGANRFYRFAETTVWNTLTSRLTPSMGYQSHRFPTIGSPCKRSREVGSTPSRDLRRALASRLAPRASRLARVRGRASP
jgi:hypothetical protein